MSRAKYDRVRVKEAEALDIRIATLDKEFEALRPRVEDEAQGSDVVLYEPEPWPSVVSGAELLDDIVATIRTYVVIPIEEARTVALWVSGVSCLHGVQDFPAVIDQGAEFGMWKIYSQGRGRRLGEQGFFN